VQLTKTTTRAFAASLAMVAAGGTIAGAAVFHLPILGINGAAASANSTPHTAEPAAAAAHNKAHRRVVVKTRFADVVVHVPAPSSGTVAAAADVTAPSGPAPTMEPAPSTGSHDSGSTISEPQPTTTTSVATPTTMGGHDDGGDHASGPETEDAAEVPEHQGATTTTTTTVVQP